MLIAILVSNVAARVRTQAVTATEDSHHESLYAFRRKLAAPDAEDGCWATAYQDRVDAQGAGGAVVCRRRGADRQAVSARGQLDKAILPPRTAWGNDRRQDAARIRWPGAKRLSADATGRGPIASSASMTTAPGRC